MPRWRLAWRRCGSRDCRVDAIREVVRRSRGRAKVEVSGSVSLDRMPELADTGAAYVAIAALTAAAPPVDMTFELTRATG